MKKILLFLMTLISSNGAFASGNVWQLCQAKFQIEGQLHNIVVNSFERRGKLGAQVTEYTLIYGGWNLSGSLDTTDVSFDIEGIIYRRPLALIGNNTKFKGAIYISQKGIQLEGKFSFGTREFIINPTLFCAQLDN